MFNFILIVLFLTVSPSMSLAAGITDNNSGPHPGLQIDITLVPIKGGCYKMGDTFSDGYKSEKPVHEVCISDFFIGTYLVTQAQWAAVMGTKPSVFVGDRRPVESVSWEEAQQFITKLNAMTGRQYRLPTEAEWEYAARGGGTQEKWSGTSDESRLGNYAWYGMNSDEMTHEVGSRKANELGLYDMAGNVWEWVQDWYEDIYYEVSPRDNPQGPPVGSRRVMRGGGWRGAAGIVRAASRGYLIPSRRYYDIGFRLALPATQ
jgi:formylglycine-generating enzyme required for sulfatase activity